MKNRFAPIQDPEKAREAYGISQLNRKTIWKMSDYDVLYSEFESDCVSFKEIGIRYGTTRERIRQIYSRFFSAHIPRRPDGRTRQRICARKIRVIKKTERQNRSVSNNPAISALKSTAESLGLEVRVISLRGRGGRIISIGSRHCSIYSCSHVHKFGAGRNFYWSFSLNSATLKHSEFVILVTKEGEKFRFFIVPTHNITAKFPEIERINLYVPQKMVDPWCRTGRKSIVGICQYENRWDFLGVPHSVIKKAVPKIQVPPVPFSPA